MSTRRFISLATAALGASAMLLGSALSGHAQIPPGTILTPGSILVPPESTSPISDVVAFTGLATITNDNGNSALGVPCASTTPEPDGPAAVDLVGCGGSFQFGSAICEGVSDSTDGDGVEPPGGCSVTANGNFENLVCGTGFVQGTNVTITGFESYTGPFGLVFVGTIGVLTANLSDNDYAVGVVQLGPPTTPPSPNPADPTDCTTGFTVTGVAVAFDL